MAEEYDVFEVIDSSGQMTTYDTATGEIVPDNTWADYMNSE